MAVITEATSSRESQGTLRVHELADADMDRWDSFVYSCPEATFYHRAGWKTVIERAFEHPTYFLYAETDGTVQGVLPLGHIKSRFFGNALISTPYGVYGGIAASNTRARQALASAAEDLALRLEVDYVELRQRQGFCEGWETKDLYVTFRKRIDPDAEKNFRAIPRKQRAMVRKGIQANLKSEVEDDVERFFDNYAASYRRLGTPVLPKHFFEILLEVFGKDCEILTVTKDGRSVSSVFSYFFRNEILPFYGGGTVEARELKANDFMYWELMRLACERGLEIFDYGRSRRDTGSYRFKKHWGFEPEPLPYQYRLVRASQVPNVSPANPKYRMAVGLWKRLPLPLTKRIGPLVARNLA